MEQNKMEPTIANGSPQFGNAARRQPYAPPRVEIHASELGKRLMGTSFWGTHNEGDDQTGNNDHNAGHIFEPEYGAKAVILGQDFSFSDLWEE